ncbi:FAD-binding protein, partial [Patescibacteria group bacterium]|nr:FAD-binding protein [Patescibacteria group bacterium]
MEENIPLAEFSTFHVGGQARYFTRVFKEPDLQNTLLFAREHLLPIFILGGGSNIVISDGGFPGLVIANNINGVEMRRDGNNVFV